MTGKGYISLKPDKNGKTIPSEENLVTLLSKKISKESDSIQDTLLTMSNHNDDVPSSFQMKQASKFSLQKK